MTPSARLAAVCEILEAIDAQPRPADALVSGYFRARRYIGSKDRAEIAALTYAILRYRARLDWWQTRLGHEKPSPRGRFLVYEKLVHGQKAKDIASLFEGGKYAPAPLQDNEKRLLAALKGHTFFHPDMPDAVRWECPAWAFSSLKERFGKGLADELQALLDPAALDLRINPLKIDRSDALAALRHLRLDVQATPFSPWGLRVWNRPALGSIALLKEGAIEIQDEGSQLVAFLLDPMAGERVCDFCAGAGGKTLALSALMRNKGRVTACDVLAARLKRSGERFRRAGLHNIETRPLESEREPWVKRHKGAFDRVLVDAPCSGTGTWRRNPDARWKDLGPGLEALIHTQGSILESAARLVKDGGRLVYATCSLLPDENERQVERFLDNHPDFSVLPVEKASSILRNLPSTGAYLSLTPARHGTDGFFAAVMQKKLKATP